MPYKFRDDWDIVTRINYIQRRIIVASIAYYEFDESLVADHVYDDIVRQLKILMDNCLESEREQSEYWYVFKDWDGSTGYFLYYNLNESDREKLTGYTRLIISDSNTRKENENDR